MRDLCVVSGPGRMTLLSEIKNDVATFNRHLSYVAGDSAIRYVFDREPRRERERPAILSMRLETIISLFQGMRYKMPPPEIRGKLSESEFGEYYWKLVERNTKKPYELRRDQSADIAESFTEALSKLESSLEGEGFERAKRFPAFMSKLLHWSFPRGFPIRDQQSLKTMACAARENTLGLKKCSQHYLSRNYIGVVDFFLLLRQQLERSAGLDVLARLEEFDYTSQAVPGRLRERNTWLRVVDKWLWLRGRQKR